MGQQAMDVSGNDGDDRDACPFCHVPGVEAFAYCPHCGSRLIAPDPQADFSEFFENSLQRAFALRLMGLTAALLGGMLLVAPVFDPVARTLLGGEMLFLGLLNLHFSHKEYRCPRCSTPVDLDDVFRDDGPAVLCHNCYARIR